MIVIKRIYNWEMGHALLKVGNQDKCYGPHGHNYRLIIEISDPEFSDSGLDPANDMVINFHSLDIPIKELIAERYDHKFYVNKDDTRFVDWTGTGTLIQNIVTQDGDPTAENLLKELAFIIRKLMIIAGLQLESAELFETENASAKIYYT